LLLLSQRDAGGTARRAVLLFNDIHWHRRYKTANVKISNCMYHSIRIGAMVRYLIGESRKKQLKKRTIRGVPRLSWTRYYIEGPTRPHMHWPNARARQQGHTNCRLLSQLCSCKLPGNDVREGPLLARNLWLEPGKKFGPGLDRRRDLRCALAKLESPWGPRPMWARVVAYYFCNHQSLTLQEFQRKNARGAYYWEPDHLPIHGVLQHLRHRYCLINYLEIVTRETNQDRAAAERVGRNPYAH
jgi:hypothetical protein